MGEVEALWEAGVGLPGVLANPHFVIMRFIGRTEEDQRLVVTEILVKYISGNVTPSLIQVVRDGGGLL